MSKSSKYIRMETAATAGASDHHQIKNIIYISYSTCMRGAFKLRTCLGGVVACALSAVPTSIRSSPKLTQ